MEVKAINYFDEFDKDFDYDDFIVSGEIYIGPKGEDFVYDVFEFNVISIKRLYTNFENAMDNPIMLTRGWIIAKEFDEDVIAKEIESIVSKCKHSDYEDNYIELSAYFRRMYL